MTSENGDELLTCIDCGTTFPFAAGERQFFEARGYPPPIRCPACRALRRQKRDALDTAESQSVQVAVGPGTAAHGPRTRTSRW